MRTYRKLSLSENGDVTEGRKARKSQTTGGMLLVSNCLPIALSHVLIRISVSNTSSPPRHLPLAGF